MIHHLCKVCGMSATMVVTETAGVAWADHMATHADPEAFESWVWSVYKLF